MLNFEETKFLIVMLFIYMILIVGWYMVRMIAERRKAKMFYVPNNKTKYQYEIMVKKINDSENYTIYSFSYKQFSKEEIVNKVMRPDIYDFCILGNNKDTEKVRVEAQDIETIIINTYSVKKSVIKISEDEFMPIQWGVLSDINRFKLDDSNVYESIKKRIYGKEKGVL